MENLQLNLGEKMMSPYMAKLKQLSHHRKMHNLNLNLGLNQHLSQLGCLDLQPMMAEIENAIEKKEKEKEEKETEMGMEMGIDMETEVEMETEMETEMGEGRCSDTSSNNSSSNSSSSGGDQALGHGPGVGIDQPALEQAQVQVHCANDPARPEESGDCLNVKEPARAKGIRSSVEEKMTEPLLTEVPSPLEYQQPQYVPMPSEAAIMMASKSKLNAAATVYEMPPPRGVGEQDPRSSSCPLNAKAPIFQPATGQAPAPAARLMDLSPTGTLEGARATYHMLMCQLGLLSQANPLARHYPFLQGRLPHPLMPGRGHPRQQTYQHQHHQHQHQHRQLLPAPPHAQPHLPPAQLRSHYPRAGPNASLLGCPPPPPPPPPPSQHDDPLPQQSRSRKEPLPDLFPAVLTLIRELRRPVSYPEIVNTLAARLQRPAVELKRHIPHTLHAAVIHGYLSKEGNRYSLLSESEHNAIKRRNHEAAKRAKELEKEPLSWRKR